MPKKLRVGVIFGGRSGEHEVSLRSAESVINAMDKSRYEIVPIGITPEGKSVALATVTSNHQRLRRHDFAKTKLTTLRLKITATNGSEQARVYEVRCYDEQPV